MISLFLVSESRRTSADAGWVNTTSPSATECATASVSMAPRLRLWSRTLESRVGHIFRTVATSTVSRAGAGATGAGGGAAGRVSSGGAGAAASGVRGGSGRWASSWRSAVDGGCAGAWLGRWNALRGGAPSSWAAGRDGVGALPGTGAATAPPPAARRCSTASTRWSSARPEDSAAGSSIRAHRSSRRSRGEVDPRISPSPECTISANRVRAAGPNRSACPVMVASPSSGADTRPRSVASGTARSSRRSRNLSSRSVANRRGSCPASMTWSTAA